MNSPLGRERIEAFCATTAGNIGISAKNLNGIPIPVPTIEKQHRIVNHLAKIRNVVGTGITAQSNTSAELDALLPSILDRAFKGEL
jgi:type I restriction enzyme S subunit